MIWIIILHNLYKHSIFLLLVCLNVNWDILLSFQQKGIGGLQVESLDVSGKSSLDGLEHKLISNRDSVLLKTNWGWKMKDKNCQVVGVLVNPEYWERVEEFGPNCSLLDLLSPAQHYREIWQKSLEIGLVYKYLNWWDGKHHSGQQETFLSWNYPKPKSTTRGGGSV